MQEQIDAISTLNASTGFTVSSENYISPDHSHVGDLLGSHGLKGKYSLQHLDTAIGINLKDEDGDISMMERDDNHNYLDSEYRVMKEPDCNYMGSISKGIDASVMHPTEQKSLLVIDTNFILRHLDILKALRPLGKYFHHEILIPTVVIHELDGLKKSNDVISIGIGECEKNYQIGILARWSNDWIYESLSDPDSSVAGQKLSQRLDYDVRQDDAILDCCLYFKEKMKRFVILLSNDKNLCLKALSEDILTVSYREKMSAQLIAERIYEEHKSRELVSSGLDTNMDLNQSKESDYYLHVPKIDDTCNRIFTEIQSLVLLSVEYVMKDEYGDDLLLVEYNYKETVTLEQCGRNIHKFWVSVFSEYFKGSQITQDIWKDLPLSLIQRPISAVEIDHFVKFWSYVLKCLYMKRTQNEKEKLSLISKKWQHTISH